MAGQRARLRRDALLQVAVGGDHVGAVVDDLVAGPVQPLREHALAEREADRGGDALAERAGRRLDPRRVPVLGVAGARRAELAEVLDVVERDAVARQVQRRVEEHRGVPAGEHEAVAVGPVGARRRVLHDARVEDVRDRRERHRGPGMARVGLLDRVHRERPDRVDTQLIEGGPVHAGPRVSDRGWTATADASVIPFMAWQPTTARRPTSSGARSSRRSSTRCCARAPPSARSPGST